MPKTPRPRRSAMTRARSGYRVDVPRSLAALITGEPHLSGSATTLLARSVMYVLRDNASDQRFADLMDDDPDEFIQALRGLHAKGWMSVWGGRAYLSEPVYGPLGNLVDRVRMSEVDRRAFAQLAGDHVLRGTGEATG